MLILENVYIILVTKIYLMKFAMKWIKEKKQRKLAITSAIMLMIGFVSLILAGDMNRLLLSVVCLFLGLFLLALTANESNRKRKV
jgi:Mn2+/Fe2+ NRAMP family transporter